MTGERRVARLVRPGSGLRRARLLERREILRRVEILREFRQIDARDAVGLIVEEGARAFFAGEVGERREMFAEK